MIENRPGFTFFCHALLIASIVVVAFPLYFAFIASTQTAERMLQFPLPLLPGSEMLHNYVTVLQHGVEGASTAPVGTMMFNSLVMALTIALGKITISILSAFAIDTAWDGMIERGRELARFSLPPLDAAFLATATSAVLAALMLAGGMWLASGVLGRWIKAETAARARKLAPRPAGE